GRGHGGRTGGARRNEGPHGPAGAGAARRGDASGRGPAVAPELNAKEHAMHYDPLGLPPGLDTILRMQRTREYMRQREYSDILLDNRIIFSGSAGGSVYEPVITDVSANIVIQQLLYLQYQSRNQQIHFYINSPGGMVTATLAIYDTMQFLDCPIATYC